MTDEYSPLSSEFDSDDPERTLKSLPVPEAPTSNGSHPADRTWTNNAPVKIPAADNPPRQTASSPVYVSRATTLPAPPPIPPRTSAVRERVRRRHGRGRNSGGEWAWVIIAAAMLSVVIVASMSIFLFLRGAQVEPNILPTAVLDLSALPTPVNFRTAEGELITGRPVTLDDGHSFILTPWDGESRFTVLVMGLDRRPGETGLAYRTDTMFLVSLDPGSQRVGILSIPRDLYVAVPNYVERHRANTPLSLGENRQPGSGPQLAMQTVQYNMGIRVHDYIILDFNAAIQLVDLIGGIQVTTDHTINDRAYPDMYYGYDPFYLPAGTHTLDGRNALKFARTRHGDSDIERARRQQQVLYAVRERVLDIDMIPQLIIQAPTLLGALRDNVYTSMSMEQMIRLAWYLKDIPEENIISGVIDYRYMSNHTTSLGAQVLIPNNSNLASLMIEVFGPNYSE